MIKTILTIAFAGATGFGGYIGGSIWPAPPQWTDSINKEANDLRAKLRLENSDFAGLRNLMSDQKFTELKKELNDYSVAAGEVIEVEHDNGTLEDQLNNLAMSEATALPKTPAAAPAAAVAPAPAAKPGAPPPPVVQVAGFDPQLELCPKMTIQNAPAADAKLHVSVYKPIVNVKGVKIATYPSHGACMSSGFGTRDGRLHKGLDYHSETGGPILAGGDGTIVEMKYREDYGNMIVIDHGGGVYTRYAHLASFGKGLTPGVVVKAGEQIGLMGNTAGYQIPMHLHYELLLGDYKTPKASFGLQPVDPLTYPAA